MGLLTVAVGRTIYRPEHRHLVVVLRELRERAGLRQVEVAHRLDRPQSFVSKYEAGERRLDLVELREICAVLGVSLAELVDTFERTLKKAQR